MFPSAPVADTPAKEAQPRQRSVSGQEPQAGCSGAPGPVGLAFSGLSWGQQTLEQLGLSDPWEDQVVTLSLLTAETPRNRNEALQGGRPRGSHS